MAPPPTGSALFVCTHNSARSQLAATLWRRRTGAPATSAGTHPAREIHPGAVIGRRKKLPVPLDHRGGRIALYGVEHFARAREDLAGRGIQVGPRDNAVRALRLHTLAELEDGRSSYCIWRFEKPVEAS